MKTKTLFICILLTFLIFSLGCVSASENVSDDSSDVMLGVEADSVSVDDFEIQQDYASSFIVKGEYFKIIVNVTNVGQTDYENLTFFYQLPEGLESIIWPSEYVNNYWTLDSFHPGESDSLTIVCLPLVSNTTLTSSLMYGTTVLSTLDIPIQPSADVAISEERFFNDDLIYWYIHVINYGPDNAENTVVFNLPQYLTYSSNMGEVVGSQWRVGNLKNGQKADLLLILPEGEYSYTFIALSDIFDPEYKNNIVSGSFEYDNSSDAPVKVVDKDATGNPIMLLLFAFILIPLTRFKRE